MSKNNLTSIDETNIKNIILESHNDKNRDIGPVNWSRVIEDELFIEKFKSLVKDKKCLN